MKVQTTSYVDICSLDKAEGNCDDQLVRWYHDPTTRECVKFTYTGCNGNENNFGTKADCLTACSNGYLNTGFLDCMAQNFFKFFPINSQFSDDLPCESEPGILEECIVSSNGEILKSRLADENGSVWFFDIVAQKCRSIREECYNLASSNQFDSLDVCRSQCMPNMSEKKTEGKKNI